MMLARLAVILGLATLASPRPVHPLHTTLTEIEYAPAEHRAHITIKLFVDDFGSAIVRRTSTKIAPDKPPTDAEMFAYVQRAFALTDKGGRPIALEWNGTKRASDLVWVSLYAPLPNGPSGVRVRNDLMFDMFSDQANIVQARYDGKLQSLLFTKGDGPKPLP